MIRIHRTSTWARWAVIGLLILHATGGRAAESLPWTVVAPSGVEVLSPGDPIRLTVRVSSEDAQGFRVLDYRILEQTDHSSVFSSEPSLCKLEPDRASTDTGGSTPGTPRCNPIGTLSKGQAFPILLRPRGPSPTAGHFSGPVTFVSDSNPSGQTVNVDFYVTTGWHHLGGIVVILISSVVGWLISNWAKNRFNRGQLLLPAAFAQQRLEAFRRAVTDAPAAVQTAQNCVNTLRKIGQLQNSLSDEVLEAAHFIPASTPSPGTNSPLHADDYTRFLATINAWITVLDAVVGRGMVQAWGARGEPSVTDQLVVTALRSLDAIVAVETLPAIANVDTAVTAALQPLRAANAQALPPGGAPRSGPASAVTQLRVQLTYASQLIWVGTTLATTLAGSYILVYHNLGFGLVTDYIACVSFGLGLPTGAAMLQQSSQSVATALGVK